MEARIIHTLARPWALQSTYGGADAGRVNGFARGGPVLVALLYDQAGAVSVSGGLGAALLMVAPISRAVLAASSSTEAVTRWS